MEAFATGLKRIFDACTEVGVKVEFLRDDYGFTVRFHRHCGEGWNQALKQAFSGKGPEKRPETKNDEMLSRCEAVLHTARSQKFLCHQLRQIRPHSG